MALIKPISSSSIKRLVAGQAITDLSSSVKELVDNAIDANATRISIKLYNQGLECIELTDDGDGVPKSSREFMAMRHATSKLRQFEDLYNNNTNNTTNDDNMNNSGSNEGRVSALGCAPTLGFRGEALFCLANLSRSLKVCTKALSDDTTSSLGETFCFNDQGQIIPESIVPTPRSVGTTVSVYGLMESLPVRRVDMVKRIKAQNMKLIKLMQGYAILCSGVQFTVTDVGSSTATNNNNNSSSKNNARKKSVVRLSTSASNKTMDARVASVLGTKFLAGLTRIELDLKSVVVVNNNGDSSGVKVANNERDENDDNNSSSSSSSSSDSRNNSDEKWQMTGLISHSPTSPNPGNARDMQFFSINGRPVDLPSVSRVIGDVWRTFDPSIEMGGGGNNSSSGSSRKRPACVLAFSLPASMYDVNLAPDKREVMFTEETSIIGCIREGLMKLWTEQSEGKFRANEVERRSAAGGGAAAAAGVKSSITKEESNPAGVTQHPITQNDDQLTQSEGNVVCEDITPKPSRKTAAAVTGHGDNGSFVTPGPDSTNANNRLSLLSSSTPSSGETDETNNEESHHLTEENTIPIVQRDKATLQERRSWEQTQLNFRRIENENLRQEMQRVLGPSSDGESHRCSQQQARRDIEDVDVPSAPSYEESTDSVEPRKSKRHKRQRNHDVSFLDKFAFGSKQQEETVASESESESEEDKMDASPPIRCNEIASNSRGNLVGRGRASSGARMLVARSVSVTETPRATSLGKRRTQQTANETSKRMHVAVEPPKDTAVQPSETVWGNFSGTKNVILQSQGAYLSSRKMSTQLQSSICQDNIQGNSNDDEKSTLSLCKEDIRHMSIIGQFNLGFILARDRSNHLWIFDQHACDEKYNFERLCKETVIHEQKLIAPLPMELSPSEEHCVLEHMDIFERNGFRFSYDPEKEPLHRLSLTALPHSGSGGDGRKAVQFGKEDVGALCAMLGADGTSSAAGFVAGFGSGADGSGMVGNNAVRRFAGLAGSHNGSSVMRLPKAIAMFASRACRVSNFVFCHFSFSV